MRRWLTVGALVVAVGCGAARNDDPTVDAGSDGGTRDAGLVDTGLSLADRQFVAANTLRNEMGTGITEGTDRYNMNRGAYPEFSAAGTRWREAMEAESAAVNTDASLPDRRAISVQFTITQRFPAYCAVMTSLPGFTPSRVPRIRCGEPVPPEWWRLYEE